MKPQTKIMIMRVEITMKPMRITTMKVTNIKKIVIGFMEIVIVSNQETVSMIINPACFPFEKFSAFLIIIWGLTHKLI